MHFTSLSPATPHDYLLQPRQLSGAVRPYEPLGGSRQSEELLFRLLDLTSYLHARRGVITREDIAAALPGWGVWSDTAELRLSGVLAALRATMGMSIAAFSEPGEPTALVVRNRFASPLLAYAAGRAPSPSVLAAATERDWTTTHCLHLTCGILRTVALTCRDVWLQPTALVAQWPVTPDLQRQFIRRWSAREDLRPDHHHALRFLWRDGEFRLSSRWPASSPASNTNLTSTSLEAA